MTTEAEHYAEAVKLAGAGPAKDQSNGKYASTLVACCVKANISSAVAQDLFDKAHNEHHIKMGVFKDAWKTQNPKPTVGDKAQKIMLSILADAELWHDQDNEPHATFTRGNHRENVQIESPGFSEWLTLRFFEATGAAASTDSIKRTVALGVARARGPNSNQYKTWIRVAEDDDAIYLDLGDDDWTVIKITSKQWGVVKDPPVRFRRGAGEALPMPERGGDINDLWQFVKVSNEGDRMLMLAWLVAALRPDRPFCILTLSGPAGSTKSSAASFLRGLIDPCDVTAGLPANEDDLMIAASAGWIFDADNISGFGARFADALCRLATGGGLRKRRLYTTADAFTLKAKRPILLNGVNPLSRRQDLMDRTILVWFPLLPEEDRESEKVLNARFKAARPKLLGALLDAVSMALGRVDEVELNAEELPRMADFAIWAEAAGPSFGWEEGAFPATYKAARETLLRSIAEGELFTRTIVKYIKTYGAIMGTASALLELLNGSLDVDLLKKAEREKEWPKNANAMGKWLGNDALGLSACGVYVEKDVHPTTRTTTYFLIAKDEYALDAIEGKVERSKKQATDVAAFLVEHVGRALVKDATAHVNGGTKGDDEPDPDAIPF